LLTFIAYFWNLFQRFALNHLYHLLFSFKQKVNVQKHLSKLNAILDHAEASYLINFVTLNCLTFEDIL